ncbi:ATP-binding cassette domain-containing protein (plasmid) [Vibrio sp. nBUS_14]|uniref:ATP-binding cassette domain-containing protein n=1 Tax=Vibrio sp. nBUS_14 TaxID=3395321 RepID=UPI003EBD0D25
MLNETQLFHSISYISTLNQSHIEHVLLKEAVEESKSKGNIKERIKKIESYINIKSSEWREDFTPEVLPIIYFKPQQDGKTNSISCGVIFGTDSDGNLITKKWSPHNGRWEEEVINKSSDLLFYSPSFYTSSEKNKSESFTLIKKAFLNESNLIFSLIVVGIVINFVALGVSFYTMQVYDRVLPTGANQTLFVLSVGVFLAIVYEFISKSLRLHVSDKIINKADKKISRSVFYRLLQIRLDQLPCSLGTLSSQIKGYEIVRNLLSNMIQRAFVDIPFSILFLSVIFYISGFLVLIPLFFLILTLSFGLICKRKTDKISSDLTNATNLKMGLLVESIEGAESIKSGQAGWRMLSKWTNLSNQARDDESTIRLISDRTSNISALFQHCSYISLVAGGALLVQQGGLTMGGIIACTILSGRIFQPLSAVPSLMVQWSHSKAALKGLDELWALECDHHGQNQPIALENISGDYYLEGVKHSYSDMLSIQVDQLKINSGEKVAILGPIGSGKTTFLRLLSGIYKPTSGRVLIDDVDINYISKVPLSKHIGFVMQDSRLFAGTVRENLLLGIQDPGDSTILNVAKLTGLSSSLLSKHPKGLEMEVSEGGRGLSGGQRQLINLTRIFLRSPSVWLLDEPTSSMDGALEARVKQALRSEIKKEHTMILVTHKYDMLDLVDRIIVLVNNKVVLDGDRDAVIKKLNSDNKGESNGLA